MKAKIKELFKENGYTDLKYLCQSKYFRYSASMTQDDISDKKTYKSILKSHHWKSIYVHTAKDKDNKFCLVAWFKGDYGYYICYQVLNDVSYNEKPLYKKNNDGSITIIPNGINPKLNCWDEFDSIKKV